MGYKNAIHVQQFENPNYLWVVQNVIPKLLLKSRLFVGKSKSKIHMSNMEHF